MDPLSLIASTIAIVEVGFQVTFYIFGSLADAISYFRFYGLSGVLLWVFGSRAIFRMQTRILTDLKSEDAKLFRELIQSEANMTAIAGAIVAQVGLTASVLPFISSVHWVAQALFVFSFVTGLMAVYYAINHQRVVGRVFEPKEIRAWIRGAGTPEEYDPDSFIRDMEEFENFPHRYSREEVERLVRTVFYMFRPGVASVLASSAAHALLWASLASLLSGFGVYLGFVWRSNLDQTAGSTSRRDVFIVYIVGLVASFLVYQLSVVIKADENRANPTELISAALEGFLRRLRRDAPAVLRMTEEFLHTGQSYTEQSRFLKKHGYFVKPLLLCLQISRGGGDEEASAGDQKKSSKVPNDNSRRLSEDVAIDTSTAANDTTTRTKELIQKLRDAAELRKSMAEVDMEIARRLELLTQL